MMGRKGCTQGGISGPPKVCRCEDGVESGGEGWFSTRTTEWSYRKENRPVIQLSHIPPAWLWGGAMHTAGTLELTAWDRKPSSRGEWSPSQSCSSGGGKNLLPSVIEE